jgi:hypothetical protein
VMRELAALIGRMDQARISALTQTMLQSRPLYVLIQVPYFFKRHFCPTQSLDGYPQSKYRPTEEK